MSLDTFPSTRAAILRLEEMYASGKIERPSSKPVRDDTRSTLGGQTHAPLHQCPAVQERSSAVSVTIEVTDFDLPASQPVNISVSISAASDGPISDRPSVTGERSSARRAGSNFRYRMRRLGPAESAR